MAVAGDKPSPWRLRAGRNHVGIGVWGDPPVLLLASKGAPVPIPRQARSDAAPLVIRALADPLAHGFRRGIGRQAFAPRGRFDPVFFPLAVHCPAVSASPVESPLGMIISVLVERYLPHGMLPAKHIPTVPAMMPSFEEPKGFLADRRVAD